MTYDKFFVHAKKFQDIAIDYAKSWYILNNHYEPIDYIVVFQEKSVRVYFAVLPFPYHPLDDIHWQSEYIEIPIVIFSQPKIVWEAQLLKEHQAKELAKKQQRQEEQEQRVKREIEQAKKLLAQHGWPLT